ncbi:hypothetical protein [Neisseria musculi]|uniref:hypothetical protein n=1 Tax=Neisseria musculi TaxID=1815583 RepID=UPI00164B62B3|nr:hypothetical protein [Neisseria musculi]
MATIFCSHRNRGRLKRHGVRLFVFLLCVGNSKVAKEWGCVVLLFDQRYNKTYLSPNGWKKI